MTLRKLISFVAIVLLICVGLACKRQSGHDSTDTIQPYNSTLSTALDSVISSGKGRIAVAIIFENGDTLSLGYTGRQPLMSVFKLHQAIAVCHTLDRTDTSIDSVLHICAAELNPDTWSPIITQHGRTDMDLSIRELMEYLLLYSDNNASNILFDRIVDVSATDSIVRSLTPAHDFRLLHTEHDMQLNHPDSYDNAATAIDCARLIRAVFTDSLISEQKQETIRDLLGRCSSAGQRMAAAVAEIPDVQIAHRTGSGYTNDRGEIVCINDVAMITLPSGERFAISVMIADYPGSQQQADSTIAEITRTALRHISSK